MEQIKLDIVPAGISPVAHASQFDNGRQIRFNLFNQGTPYTLTGAETVTMVVNGEEENITNTSDNYVIWDVAEEDCETSGVIACELRIVLGSMLIGSKNFFLEVEIDPYDGKNLRIITVGPADICTFETTLPEPLQSVKCSILATGGNGTPDNPIPINGYTEANITRCGVNMWDEQWEQGTYDASDGSKISWTDAIRSKNKINITPNTTYYTPYNARIRLCFYLNGTFVSSQYISTSGPWAFTTPSGVNQMTFGTWNDYGSAYDPTNKPISINYPSTDTAYHTYTGNTYTISFGQTVYGGVLDVTRGKMSVKYARAKISDLTWYYTSALSCFNTTSLASVVKGGNVGLMCECESPLSVPITTASINANDNFVRFNKSASGEAETGNFAVGALVLKDTTYSDVESMLLAIGNYYICYELATPFDIDLTPVQIRALVGENNVFGDCGQTTVEYLDEE